MKRCLVISVLLGLAGSANGCGEGRVAPKSDGPAGDQTVTSHTSKEIIADNVLAAQLAPRDGFEARTTFATTEPIQASLYLTGPAYIEPRRISASLVCGGVIVEEQSVAVGADEKRQEFDFRFAKTPHRSGACLIKFV